MAKILQLNDEGLLEHLDLDSGLITPAEVSLQTALAESPLETHQLVRSPNGSLVLAPRGASTDSLKQIQGNSYSMPYSTLLALQICEEIAHGATLTSICRKDCYPTYGQLCRWRREHPEFNKWLGLARKDRGEVFFDRALDSVEEATEDRDSIALARMRSDFYKAAAKVSNPAEFNDRVGPDNQVNVAIGSFQLETGVRRVGDSGFNEDEAAKIILEIEGGKNGGS